MRARPVRERHELLRFLAALEAEEQPWLDLFTVLLYVGYRRRAIEAMRWSDLDLVSGTWTVPGERAKNSDPIVLPVVGSALTTLQTRSRPRQAVSFIHLDLADDPYEPLQRHRFGARGALRTGRGTGGDARRGRAAHRPAFPPQSPPARRERRGSLAVVPFACGAARRMTAGASRTDIAHADFLVIFH